MSSDATLDPKPITHGQLFRQNWLKISGTFALLAFENLFTLLEPLVLGIAINGLIAKEWTGFVLLCAVMAGSLTVGTLRRVYDTRVYAGIYAKVGADLVEREQAKNAPISQISARANLIREVVDFFENELPIAATAAIALFGSVIMIAVLDGRVFWVTFGACLGVMAIFAIASPRIKHLNKALNDEIEQQVAIFESREKARQRSHFKTLARWRISLSDLESRNFSLTYLLIILAMLYGLYDGIMRLEAPIGTVFALMTYLMQFAEGVVILPYTYQQLLRTQDITGRVNE